uniref:PRA1 family protein n=1 Tax=Strigamia maritima TaxID=126957 RepID=T1J861_STRMM
MMSVKTESDVQIAPLRPLGEFLLESARFQVPNFKDPEKWGNRVLNNLLYYQTNYFLLSVVIFLIVGLIHPVKMLYGFLAILVAFGLFYYGTNSQRAALKFKHDHPVLSVIIIFTGMLISGYFIVYMLGSVVVFLFGILLPMAVAFIHASMRLRNIKNKFTNKLEFVGLKKTPMGIILEALGQEDPGSIEE